MRDGTATRTKILDAAEALLLKHGVGGTAVDRVLERAGITKGAFFYHFESKDALLLKVIERFAERDREQFKSGMARAEELTSDPLQQILVFIGLLVEEFAKLEEPYPGCLYASFALQHGLAGPDVLKVVQGSVAFWRAELSARFETIIARKKPRLKADATTLADGFLSSIEGGIILSLAFGEPKVLAAQLRQYRNYLELMFAQ